MKALTINMISIFSMPLAQVRLHDDTIITIILMITFWLLGMIWLLSKMSRKKIERKIKLQELTINAIIENNLDPISVYDSKGEFVKGNTKALALANHNEMNWIKEGISSFIEGKGHCRIKKHFLDALQGTANVFTTMIVSDEGQEWILQVKNIPIELEGKSEGVMTILHDLTEQKKLEKKFIETSGRLETFFNVTNDAINFTTADSKVLYANPAFERMFGWSLEEMLQYELPIHISEDAEERKTLQASLENKEHISNYETRLKRRDGTCLDVAITLSPILDENGKLNEIAAITRDISERIHYQEQLEQMAYYDALTNIPNRRLFYDRLSQTIKKAKRNKSNFALFYLDCDRFKWINDTFGHDTGDLFLRGFVERVGGCIRESDTLARLGGDEFAIILDRFETTQDVKAVAERIVANLQIPWHFNEHEFITTTSIGIAVYPDDGVEMDTLMLQADRALYTSKENGRNCFSFTETNGAKGD